MCIRDSSNSVQFPIGAGIGGQLRSPVEAGLFPCHQVVAGTNPQLKGDKSAPAVGVDGHQNALPLVPALEYQLLGLDLDIMVTAVTQGGAAPVEPGQL